MNFDFDIEPLLPDEINKIERVDLVSIRNDRSRGQFTTSRCEQQKINQLIDIINQMGLASAKAQGLNHTITTGEKMKESDHVLYVMVDVKSTGGKGAAVLGILKMGYKKLFLMDQQGNQHEMSPPCVLDFYVHESCQRRGLGKKMFEFMLKDLNVAAYELAIDRPSPKFLAFLATHYRLSNPVHQCNRFTVFAGIFPEKKVEDARESQSTNFEHARRSDPVAIRDCYKPKPCHRQSYPPMMSITKMDVELDKLRTAAGSSVASVVFGQFQSNLGTDKFMERHMNFGSPCKSDGERVESSADYKILRPPMDSSYNIFGVPSPAYSQTAAGGHQG